MHDTLNQQLAGGDESWEFWIFRTKENCRVTDHAFIASGEADFSRLELASHCSTRPVEIRHVAFVAVDALAGHSGEFLEQGLAELDAGVEIADGEVLIGRMGGAVG